MDGRVDHRHHFEIDGEQYYCHMTGMIQPRTVPLMTGVVDDFDFTVKFIDYFEPPGRWQKVCFFRRDRIVERREFCSTAEAIVSEMLSDTPWPIPEVLRAPPEPWLRGCCVFGDARSYNVIWAELEIYCPYRPGGYEYFELDLTDYEESEDEDEDEIAIEALLERVGLSDEDGDSDADASCSICLEDMTHEVVRTACSHLFHRHCVIPWLELRKSCPYCRRALDAWD